MFRSRVRIVHPQDPARLFTAVMHWRGKAVDVAGFYSDDGGTTWQLGCDLVAPPGKELFDPTVAFGPDGAAYLVHMLSHLRNVPKGTAERVSCTFTRHPMGAKRGSNARS